MIMIDLNGFYPFAQVVDPLHKMQAIRSIISACSIVGTEHGPCGVPTVALHDQSSHPQLEKWRLARKSFANA
jgi:hypothetical protein